VSAKLARELLEPHGAEDALAEEALDQREQGVLADRKPLAVPFDLAATLPWVRPALATHATR
jgi:hypothetical protein